MQSRDPFLPNVPGKCGKWDASGGGDKSDGREDALLEKLVLFKVTYARESRTRNEVEGVVL